MELSTRKIYSDIPKIKGFVEIYDPVPMSRIVMFDEVIRDIREDDPKLLKTSTRLKLVPALLQCVKIWQIEGFPEQPTVEDFPDFGSNFSKIDIIALLIWVTNIFLNLGNGKDPNA